MANRNVVPGIVEPEGSHPMTRVLIDYPHEKAGTADQAHCVEGVGIDLLALVETQQQLARGNMENVPRHVESKDLSFIRDHRDKVGSRLLVNCQQVVFHLAVNRWTCRI